MSDVDEVLFANEVFYRAFADRNPKVMEELWSNVVPVSCLHPGWGPIFDRQGIVTSWAAILTNPESPEIKCRDAKALVYGDVASVVCFEELPGGSLIATNVFHREGKVWKIVHHQAGPTSAAPSDDTTSEDDRQLH